MGKRMGSKPRLRLVGRSSPSPKDKKLLVMRTGTKEEGETHRAGLF